jgi:hypothetical protein
MPVVRLVHRFTPLGIVLADLLAAITEDVGHGGHYSARERVHAAAHSRRAWSLKSCVFRVSLLENRNVRVGVFPRVQKILISGFCLATISR